MDFSTTPPSPLDFGRGPQHYESIVGNPLREKLSTCEALDGSINFEEGPRCVSITFVNEQAFEFEIKSIEPGDTFLGVPIPMRATKFRNRLKKKGIATIGDADGIVIPEYGVSFYVFEYEVATICWETEPPTSHGVERGPSH